MALTSHGATLAKKIEMPCLGHELSRVTFGVGDKPHCDGCGGSDGHGHACKMCSLQAHEECTEWSLKFAGHSKHNLKKVSPGKLDYTDGQCHFCGFIPIRDFYHCSTCNFSIDEYCKLHQQNYVFKRKSHEHPFMLMMREITFTCNACGLLGERNPFICITCNLMIHRDCIDLPKVININRHDHRIYLTNHFGRGNWELCGVCRRKIDWNFGGYSCKRCPDYALHSKCATKFKVWDMIDLENVREEEEEILDPYKMVNGEKEIVHFSHQQHSLRLEDEDVADIGKIRCDACSLPINDGPFYKCMQCNFLLHKVCANFPRRKRHVLYPHKFDLKVTDEDLFKCSICNQCSNGFRYVYKKGHYFSDPSKSEVITLDVRCGSISEPFHHELHKHPLYFTLEESKTCVACGVHSPNVLCCIVCDFALDIKCATLPTKVKHRCDDHFLSLCHGGENMTTGSDLWCDICETTTDSKVWFYTCKDCGIALHIKCVLGDLYYLRRRRHEIYGYEDMSRDHILTLQYIFERTKRRSYRSFTIEVISNDSMTRPLCCVCKLRCLFPAYVTIHIQHDVSFCSLNCLFLPIRRTIFAPGSCSMTDAKKIKEN